jgi:aspartyl-tRNA(Asn)/glutamyl-tRNA(Gln) amidotransferase subunit C
MTHEAIKLQEVNRIAELARLDLTDAQKLKTVEDFERILTQVDELQKVDTTGVLPTQHAVSMGLTLRPDTVHQSLSADEALRNAPERLGDGFGVPKIIE